MTDSLYREEILEHYRNPQNFGSFKDSDATAKQVNPFCGDEIELYIKFKKNTVEDIRFQGKGCAITIAAASLVTEYMKGKPLGRLTKFTEEDMLELLGVEVSETRKKCALLPLAVFKDAIQSKS